VQDTVWDDYNGNGIQDPGEVSKPALVLCDNVTTSLTCIYDVKTGQFRNATVGKVITNLGQDTYTYNRNLASFGGNAVIEGGAEILFPLPFIKDQRSLQTTIFLDAGNVFDTHCSVGQRNCFTVSADQMKASVGLGLTWISSFGPMTFSLAKPISKQDQYDQHKIFDFSLGQTF